jgi:Tol biopolymer transport system component
MIVAMKHASVLVPIALALVVACNAEPVPLPQPVIAQATPPLTLPQETRLTNVRQLTLKGENAEAYFSFDGTKLSFQSTGQYPCDQIFTMNVDGSDVKLVSTGHGRTTCSHFTPDGRSVVYASTHLGGKECPPVPPREPGKYYWPIYDTYDIFKVNTDGTGLTQLTKTKGYDAEATVARDGRIVFTSTRDGDMEIYSMNPDGTDVRRLTRLPGPDGGPFFSPDGQKVVFRGKHPGKGKELDDYFALLKKNLWQPTSLDIFVMDRDGSNLTQVTKDMPGANWAPFFAPGGQKIIFASNHKNPTGRAAQNFDLFLINVDGTGLEQITFSDKFDGFPMFSPDGRKLIWASNRNSAVPTDTNLFIADWK